MSHNDFMDKPLTKKRMLEALTCLDKPLPKSVRLIMGGGGAMILAHQFPLATTDIDAVPKGMTIEELDPYVKQVGLDLNLPGDWLNPYFSTFAVNLPSDFETRLIQVYLGKNLSVMALGKEDMLIMKCYAHRSKDIGHARALLKLGADTDFVEKHIEALKRKQIPGCKEALDFLDDLLDSR